jgi:hypothetical protein
MLKRLHIRLFAPYKAADFAAILSINIPIVILLGKALGLMIISGVIPLYVNGISIFGQSIDKTPFCPCLDENLSPITGLLSKRSFIKTLYAVLF